MLSPQDRLHLRPIGMQRREVRHHEGTMAQHMLNSVGPLEVIPVAVFGSCESLFRMSGLPADTK